MLYPPINELLDKVESRYTLVIAASKRARQLIDGAEVKVSNIDCKKPVSMATQEIYEEEVLYTKAVEEEE